MFLEGNQLPGVFVLRDGFRFKFCTSSFQNLAEAIPVDTKKIFSLTEVADNRKVGFYLLLCIPLLIDFVPLFPCIPPINFVSLLETSFSQKENREIHYIILYYIILYYIILYCVIFCCIILCCTILYRI